MRKGVGRGSNERNFETKKQFGFLFLQIKLYLFCPKCYCLCYFLCRRSLHEEENVTIGPKKSLKKQSFSPLSGLGFAYRIGIEFTSGILVGLLMGYAIDTKFNTQPWGLVVMIILGASAGLLNIFRLLGMWGNPDRKEPPSPPHQEDKDG